MAPVKNLVLNVCYLFAVGILFLCVWGIKVKYEMYFDERTTEYGSAKKKWEAVCRGKDADSLGLDTYCSKHHKIMATDPSGRAALDLLYMLVLCEYVNCADLATILAANVGKIYFGFISVLFLLAVIVYYGCVRPHTSGYSSYHLPTAQGYIEPSLKSVDPYYSGKSRKYE